ncbi:HCLS1-binding protein 3-like [Dysidea avara]|uniref:HCLS1-binding protein 3-like n=1 Tax=Dysidea avara TaxID=196820 RepID=UPI00331ADD78
MPRIKGLQLTKRELKNVSTGIDLTVPSYESASKPKEIKFYHVVAISRLVHFKQAEHSPEDVVQFMVRKQYSDFEQLQTNLLENHPELTLPALPRWNIWFLSEDDIEDRRVSFDSLLKKLSRDAYFATCPAMLDFLGVDQLSDRKYYIAREKFLQSKKKEAKTISPDRDINDLFDEDEPEQLNEEILPTTSAPIESIFKSSNSKMTAAAYKIPEDTSHPSLMIPNEGNETTGSGTIPVEDNSELLTVDDSLDDLLKLTTNKTKPKAKPISKQTMPLTKPPGVSHSQKETEDNLGVESMDDTDIARYIEQEQNADSDIDLFS